MARLMNPAAVRRLWLGLGLILLIWLTRLIAIDTFPPFIDEMIHLYGSEQVYTKNPLVNTDLGRQMTIWWLALFQVQTANPIWIGRVATMLAVLPGVAALMGIGRLAAGTWGMLVAGMLYLFSTYHQFFGRLALADPVAASAVLLALYFAYRLTYRAHNQDALLTGILLFVGFGAKVSVLPFFGIPVAAALSLWPSGRTWRQQTRWLIIALGTTFGLSAAFVIGLRLLGHDFLSNSLSYGLTRRSGISLDGFFSFETIVTNTTNLLGLLSIYLGPILVMLLILALGILILRRQFYLPLCFVGPTLFLLSSPVQESRFLVAPVAILLLVGAVVVGNIVHRTAIIQIAAIAGLVVWGLAQWLPFTITAATNPAALPLPQTDFTQYVYSDASGFGFAQARDELQKRGVQRVIGLLSNCQGFRYLSLAAFPVECPQLNPSGANRDELYDLMMAARAEGVFAVLEAIPFVPATAPGTPLLTIKRPGDGIAFTIYDLAP